MYLFFYPKKNEYEKVDLFIKLNIYKENKMFNKVFPKKNIKKMKPTEIFQLMKKIEQLAISLEKGLI